MVSVATGQCGLCAHFGEDKKDEPQLIQIRTKHQAPEDYVLACGHPRHATLNLKVTAISGCTGFTAAEEVQAAV